MTLDFKAIELNEQTEYNRRLGTCLQISSDYTFTNLWGWAEEYELSWAWDEELVWIKQNKPTPCYWAPVGNWQNINWRDKLALLKDLGSFVRIPEKLVALWTDVIQDNKAISSREHWDYLYKMQDLIKLKGNRFHKKKNLFKQFQKRYDFQYHPMNESMVNKALLMQEDWCIWKNCEASAGLLAENLVIERILSNWSALENLSGGIIMINTEVAAFTVGERIEPDTMVIHIEKGLGSYKGIYQAINKLFLENSPDISLVNREQDLGNEGLRTAKLSYHPIDYVKKFTINL